MMMAADNLNVLKATSQDGSVKGLVKNPSNIQVLSPNGNVIGRIQSLSFSENASVSNLNAIGFEGVVCQAKGVYTGGQIQASLVELYDETAGEAFDIVDTGGGVNGLKRLNRVISVKQQRTPINIRIQEQQPDGSVVITTYINCLMTSLSRSISAGSSTIMPSVNFTYMDVI